ncbi:MAG: hypothetical protein RIR10_863 [Planctomycetota bacterium]|jgi:hypothetical protein
MRPVVRETELIRQARGVQGGTAAAGVLRPQLEIVDAGREDIGPLATSLKSQPVDARLPTGFHRVYRVPGSDSLLMRGNGALFAVFSESVYDGGRAILPPGTVYHLGMPNMLPQPIHPDAVATDAWANRTESIGDRIGTTVDARIDLRIRPTRPTPIGSSARPDGDQSRLEPTYTLEAYLNAARDSGMRAPDSTLDSTPKSQESAADSAPVSARVSAQNSSSLAGPTPVDAVSVQPAPSRVTDVYAYLKLGPARITRAN